MNFIATVNAPAHGNIAVTFSDIEKRVLGAWRDNETVETVSTRKMHYCTRHHWQSSLLAGI